MINKDEWRNILSFLTPQDFRSLSLTCKALHYKTKNNEDIMVRQFHANIVANQDSFLCNIYQNCSYRQILKSEVNKCFSTQNSDLIKHFATAKLQLSNFLSKLFGQEKSKEFVNTINTALIKPKLPPLRLRREYQNCETFSIYQTYLNDIYHGLDDESKTDTYHNLLDEECVFELSPECVTKLTICTEQNKDEILYARWYLSNEIVAAIPAQEDNRENINDKIIRNLSKRICKMELKKRDSKKTSKNKTKRAFYEKLATHNGENRELATKKSPLVELYINLHENFSTYCKIIHDYLANIQNPFIFISEYTAKWKNFVAAMQNIGGYLRQYSLLMNQVYEKEFAGYPNHPEFRIWRMMAKIWCHEVFCKLENKIQPLFKNVMSSYLNTFSKELKQIHSSKGSANYSDAIPEIFSECQFDVSNAICEFWNSILDMALNERTVFSLTCVDLLNFGIASGFCSSLHKLITERCTFFVQATQLKSSQKFELILDSIELIEAVVPQNIFPAIYEVFMKSLQSVLVEFFSEVKNMSSGEVVKYITREINSNNYLIKWLSSDSSDSATLNYPALSNHLQLYRKKIIIIQDVLYEREKKKLENISKGFNPLTCEVERAFLDLDRTVNLVTLKHFRDVYC